jgi:hypothetical protein
LNTSSLGTGSYNGEFSIYANDRIGAYAFIAHSDERIKTIKGKSDEISFFAKNARLVQKFSTKKKKEEEQV